MSDRPELRSFLPHLPLLLLVAVALLQLWLVRTELLSPWKGGGFGMFSTTDGEHNRNLRLYLRSGSAAFEVVPGREHERLVSHARMLPSEARLRELARRVAADHEARGAEITGVRVEVWRRRFDAELRPRTEMLRQLEVELDVPP